MKAKKSNKADLERKKGVFLQIGILLALAVVYMAFEWKTTDNRNMSEFITITQDDFEEEIISTRQEEPIKEKPMPKPKEIVITEEEVDEPILFEDPETDEDAEIIPYVMDEEVPVIDPDPIPPYMCEEIPKFPGGEEAYLKFLVKNVVYPEISKENNVSGKVYISFVIDKKGNITNVKLAKGVDPFLDKEALRVIKSMPNWKPGKQNGIAVSVTQMGCINFKLYN